MVRHRSLKSVPAIVALAASALCFGGGLAVLCGWLLDIPLLKSLSPTWVTMKANSALCFVLAGAALWLSREPGSRLRRIVALSCAATAALIGLVTLLEYFFTIGFSIDHLLFKEALRDGELTSGRMSPVTAACFVLVCVAMLAMDWKTRTGRRPALALPLIAGGASLFAFIGYLYGAAPLHSITSPFAPMALHTAMLFIVLSMGVLCARGGEGPLSVLLDEGVGSTMARSLMPLAVALPLLLGWVRLRGQQAGYYSTEVGLALFATSLVVVLSLFISRTATSMNRSESASTLARDRAEALLEESRERLDSALRMSGIGIWELDLTTLTVNRTLGHDLIFGYDKLLPEWSYEKFLTHVVPEDLIEVDAKFRATLAKQDQYNLECRIRGADGVLRWIWARGEHQRDETWTVRFMAGIVQDITARKVAEAAHASSQAILQGIIASAQDAIIAIDANHQVSLFNAAAENMFGYLAHEVLGKGLDQLMPARFRSEHDGHINAFQQTRISKRSMGEDRAIFGLRRDGSEFPIEASISQLNVNGAEMFTVILRDITERKLAEHALQQQNIDLMAAGRMKTEFLATMSHELRTPLNAIIGCSEVLRDGLTGEMTELQRRFADNVVDSAKHLLGLINDLLDLSKFDAGKMTLDLEAVDIASVLEASLSRVEASAASHGISLVIDAPTHLGAIESNPLELQQITYHLLSNAVKFTADKGQVTLRLSHVPREQVGLLSGIWPSRGFALAQSTFAEFLQVSVTDTGIGISDEGMGRLFKPFTQLDSSLARRFGGTGLGLAMVKSLVELHGGTVAVESRLGEGSRFTFWLPTRAA